MRMNCIRSCVCECLAGCVAALLPVHSGGSERFLRCCASLAGQLPRCRLPVVRAPFMEGVPVRQFVLIAPLAVAVLFSDGVMSLLSACCRGCTLCCFTPLSCLAVHLSLHCNSHGWIAHLLSSRMRCAASPLPLRMRRRGRCGERCTHKPSKQSWRSHWHFASLSRDCSSCTELSSPTICHW